MVEFAVSAVFFVLLLLGLIVVLWIGYRMCLLNYIAASGVRDGVVLFHAGSTVGGSPHTKVRESIKGNANSFGWAIADADITFCVYDPLNGCLPTTVIPNSSYFMVTVAPPLDGLSTLLSGIIGSRLSASALAINSKPISVLFGG
jgi:hypothetical protein